MIRQWMFILLFMELSTLAKSRMRHRLGYFLLQRRWLLFRFFCITDIFNLNLFRICKTQCQFITVDTKFHRVSHRCIFHHGHITLRNQTHVQKVLSQSPLATDRANRRGFPDRQFS